MNIKRELRENTEKEHKPRKSNQHSALTFAGACGEFHDSVEDWSLITD